jgi:uncharacterized membrane protein
MLFQTQLMVDGACGIVLAELREAAEKDACGCWWRHHSANITRVMLAEWSASRHHKKQEQAALALLLVLATCCLVTLASNKGTQLRQRAMEMVLVEGMLGVRLVVNLEFGGCKIQSVV